MPMTAILHQLISIREPFLIPKEIKLEHSNSKTCIQDNQHKINIDVRSQYNCKVKNKSNEYLK